SPSTGRWWGRMTKSRRPGPHVTCSTAASSSTWGAGSSPAGIACCWRWRSTGISWTRRCSWCRTAYPRDGRRLNVDILLIHAFNALLYASVLFLIAGGLSLIYGVMRIVNLAHGNLYAFGAYVSAWIIGYLTAAAISGQGTGGPGTWLLLIVLPAGA